jgi:AraC-like DNA-binding protein
MIFSLNERPSDSPFIEKIWRSQTERTGTFISQASIYCEIVVMTHNGKTSLVVRGPETKATFIDFGSIGAEYFGIVFKPGTFIPHLPPANLRDQRDANLPEANSKSFWFNGSTWQYPNFENVETFIARLMREGLLVHDPVVDSVLQGQSPALSPRSVQYRFLGATGLTHKAVQQIERAQKAAMLLKQGLSILDTVEQTGYFDQSHLTNSLKHLMGQTPARIAQVAE